ncbi:hypothetical protein [Streptomyces sp. URMC 129]|uniref:hypothetical protein n=1 Tax=Streptomyces sp. URMC 129 TaxID=3423407 RepID=UPI003F1B45D6
MSYEIVQSVEIDGGSVEPAGRRGAMSDLTMKPGRSEVTFLIQDEDTETKIVLSVEDGKEALLRKLHRVGMLADPGSETAVKAATLGAVAPGDFRSPPPQTGNGWAVFAQPELPDRLAGEVELIDPEEVGDE